MSLEKILILGVALLVIGGVYIFGESLSARTNEVTGNTADSQSSFESKIGEWTW